MPALKKHRSLVGIAATTAAMMTTVGLSAAPALGAVITSATFTGGTATFGNTVYAKTGSALTLTVVTSDTARCVDVTGAVTGRQTSLGPKTQWTFTGTAPAGEGEKSATITVGEATNPNGFCTTRTASTSAKYTLDNTGPTVSGTLSREANAAGWHNGDVTVSWSATDGASGVDGAPDPLTSTQDTNTGLNGATLTSSARDKVGNTGTGTKTVKVDKTAPTISGSRSPAPNAAGWNKTDVTVSFTCDDALSGIKDCPGVSTLAGGADRSVTGTARDNADNTASATVSDINVDKVDPTLSGAPTTSPNEAGWYKGDVKIHWTAGDALSGVASAPADSMVSGEGTGLTATASVSDRAGNTASATSSPVNIDTTAPNTSADAKTAWNNVAQTVNFTPNDAGSGVAATYYKVDDGAQQTGTSASISADGDHTLTFWSVDRAGNAEAAKTVHVQIDKTSPTITASQTPLANTNGWNSSDVTVKFVCDDSVSGIAACTDDQIVSTEAKDQQVKGTAVDNAGNSVDAFHTVSLDKTAPTIAAAVDRAPNLNNWYDANVTVSFTCDDNLSGVDACPAPKTLGEGADQSAGGMVNDAAGNTASDEATGINVDKTAPTLSGAATTAPNGAGWYTGDVEIDWTASDGLSGLDGTAPANSVITGEGKNLSASASVFDLAGNSTNKTVDGINIDRHAPTTRASVPAAVVDGWHAGPINVALTGSDELSTVDKTYYSVDGGATQTYSGSPFSFDQNGTHTIRFWSVDKAGNVEAKTGNDNVVEVKIDTTSPTITGSKTTPANATGWNNSSVFVGFICADGEQGSGIRECTDPVEVTTEGASQSVKGTAVDRVGNTASDTVGDINIDLTKPEVTGAATTAPNANGWYKGNVTIEWTATDGLSGIDGAAPADTVITGEGATLGAGPVSAFDKAGNEGTGSVSGVKIDRTAPTVDSVDATVNGDTANVTVEGSDALSGVDKVTVNGTPAAKNADGSFSRSVSGLACGANTLSVVATDKAGNDSAASTRSVTRSCLWAGNVLSPVAPITAATATGMDAFKIKSTIPVKFQVYLDAAKTRLMTAPPAGSVARIAFAKVDNTVDGETATEVLPTSTANTDNVFRWNATDYQYIYNLGTAGKASGTYRVQLTLSAADGSVLTQSSWFYFVLRS